MNRASCIVMDHQPLRLDVVDVRMLPLGDRLHHLADVDAVLDDRGAHRHVVQRDLVAKRNVLHARQRDRPVLVEDEAGQRSAGLDALDHHHGDRILGVVQYAMNHRQSSGEDAPSGRAPAPPRYKPNGMLAPPPSEVNYIIYIICITCGQPLDWIWPRCANPSRRASLRQLRHGRRTQPHPAYRWRPRCTRT